jgi:uncharacterized protein YjbJ (UPF0337 family)
MEKTPRRQARFARLLPAPAPQMSDLAFGGEIAFLDVEGASMNSDQFEGKWKQLKGTLKQRWAKLTDDDLTALSGKKDELVGRIQERYGITREQAEREADEWAAAANADIDRAERQTTASHAARRL